jgi:hypothetical protein
LSGFGGAAVEPLLWKRLDAWSNQWRGRERELEGHPITGPGPNQEQHRLGNALFGAIENARAWVVDDARRQRLLALCVTDWCRQAWSDPLPSSVPITAAYGGAIYGHSFRIGNYGAPSLERVQEKIAQYRAGTRFHWCPTMNVDAFLPQERQEMFEALARFAAAHAMWLAPYEEAACNKDIKLPQ